MKDIRVAPIALSLQSTLAYVTCVIMGAFFGSFVGLAVYHFQPSPFLSELRDTFTYMFAVIAHCLFAYSTKDWPRMEFGRISKTVGYSILFTTFGTLILWVIGNQWMHILGNFNEVTPIKEVTEDFRKLIRSQNHGAMFLLFLNVCAGGPIAEEIVFRSGLYRVLKGRFSASSAAGISSILFAAYHLSVSEFIPILVFGYFCCWAYEKTVDIRGPIFFHAAFNLINVLTTTI